MNNVKGLYDKYEVVTTDGEPVDPEALYFVLRIDNDPDALVAVKMWAVMKDNWKLVEDLNTIEEIDDETG